MPSPSAGRVSLVAVSTVSKLSDQDLTVARLIDHAADIFVALKGIARELNAWNAQPAYGLIYINGVESIMTTTDTPTPIPSDNCPAVVQWYDRLDTAIPHDKTQTNWSAEDDTGAISSAVSINPNLDTDSDDETATVVFVQSSGMFKVVATTPGASGPVRAESALYDIQPGAPAVGQITLSPAS
jgi:hypothetical protein